MTRQGGKGRVTERQKKEEICRVDGMTTFDECRQAKDCQRVT